jgi:type II secretory pathway pseudopilin PulG
MIELLTVIAILILLAAMALPNFVEMMRGRRWTAAVSDLQTMVMRARALATNVRRDFSVEFAVLDNGTTMWLESEENDVERTPDLFELQHELGGQAPLRYFMSTFYNAGGRYTDGWRESICALCGARWSWTSGSALCPKCGNTGPWNTPIITRTYYYNITYNSSLTSVSSFGDNARQSEVARLGLHLTIDRPRCRDFVSWDSRSSVAAYGYDEYPDIRIGTNGALVQTREPVICIKDLDTGTRHALTVVRCTGRVKEVPVP